jgi:hypothetical protein
MTSPYASSRLMRAGGGLFSPSRSRTILAAVGEQHQEINDVGGGNLIATVKDADGNLIGLLQMPAGGWA